MSAARGGRGLAKRGWNERGVAESALYGEGRAALSRVPHLGTRAASRSVSEAGRRVKQLRSGRRAARGRELLERSPSGSAVTCWR